MEIQMTNGTVATWLASALLASGLSACATSPPSEFYVLTPLPAADSPSATEGRRNHPALGVGPVKLPAYLDRSEIVTRTGSNSLKLANFHRWGEPVTDNFTRVLAMDLGLLVNTNQVSLAPWPRYVPVDYQVVVEADRFDVGTDDKAVLVARWLILGGGEEGNVLRSGSTVITEPAASGDYTDITAAMSHAVAELARQIAVDLNRLPARPAVMKPT
jgi:uncharacterized lipoprotein YmbA